MERGERTEEEPQMDNGAVLSVPAELPTFRRTSLVRRISNTLTIKCCELISIALRSSTGDSPHLVRVTVFMIAVMFLN